MIQLEKLTPEVYYKKSRDFQFIGRLYDLVLNSVKTNADLTYNLPLNDDSDSKWVDLMTLTLGFKPRHNYNIKQLTALCSSFMTIIRNKGNFQAIKMAGDTLMHAEGITEPFTYWIDYDTDPYNLIVSVPEKFSDTTLLKDLFIYILPAGMRVTIISSLNEVAKPVTELKLTSKAKIHSVKDTTTSVIPRIDSTLTSIASGTIPGMMENSTIIRPSSSIETEGKADQTANVEYFSAKSETENDENEEE